MKVTIQPSSLSGSIQAPASKSSMQRACAAALLTNGITTIYNAGHSNDDKAALSIIQALGAKVEELDYCLTIQSNGKVMPITPSVNCGESGLSMRMFTPIIALSEKEVVINGEGSLLTRPMDFFDEVLPQLGVKVKSNNGKLPLTIQGPLVPQSIEIDGSLSSQFLTGILMAFAGADARDVRIKINDLKSKPYINLTLLTIRSFGLKEPTGDFKELRFESEEQKKEFQELEFTVEGDWSGGAFLLVSGAIAGPVFVRGLDLVSTQADKAIMDALMSANAEVAVEAKGIKVHPGKMKAFEFDATDCPDLFPPLVALATFCDGKTIIKGVSRLEHKESSRATALQEEFGKMGIKIDLEGDNMIVQGGGNVKGAIVHSHHDHRIAMACAVAALRADGETVIEEAQAISKSYPDFYSDLLSLGASLSLPYQHFNL